VLLKVSFLLGAPPGGITSLGVGGSGRDSKDLEIRGLVGTVGQAVSVGDGGAVEQDGMGGCGRGSVRSGILE
jgi:hypothetical protein